MPFSRSFVWTLWACLVQYTIPTPTAKGTHPALSAKRLKYIHLFPALIAKRTPLTLPSFPHITMCFDTTCWVLNSITTNIINPKLQSHTKHKYLHGKLIFFEGENHETNSKSISLFSNQLQYLLCMSHG